MTTDTCKSAIFLEYQFWASLFQKFKIARLSWTLEPISWICDFNYDGKVFCFGPEIAFLEKYALKIQNCWIWNLVLRLTWICRTHFWCLLFSFLSGSTLFLLTLVQKNEIDSLSWKLVFSPIQICRIQWWS